LRERGVDEEEARWAARRDLGNTTLVKERTRMTWTWRTVEDIAQDVRYAMRGFVKQPGFSLTAILSLALGLGTSLAIYTVADHLLLRPLPYKQASQLVMIWEEHPKVNFQHADVAPGNYFAWKARNHVFQDIAFFDTSHEVVGDQQRSEEFGEIDASANLLPMLGMQPVLGRRYTEAESQRGAEPVMLISYRLWQSWFAGDRNVVGRKIAVGGRPRVIVGVLPANFYFHDRAIDLWLPLPLTVAQNGGEGRWLHCLGRLKANVSLRQAQAEMSAIAKRREIEDPVFSKGWTVALEPLRDALVRTVKPSLLVLL
jgi:putative ABC transport system permease protein